MPELVCPMCNGHFQVLPTAAAQIVLCPHCSGRVNIPASLPTPSPASPTAPAPVVIPSQPLMQRFACPSCGGHFQVPADHHGKVLTCPHCGSHVNVPASGSSPAPVPAPAPAPDVAASQPVLARFACPSCRGHFQVQAEHHGSLLTCPHCGSHVNVPASGSSPAPVPTPSPAPVVAASQPVLQRFACPSCNGHFTVPAEHHASVLACPHCGGKVRVGEPSQPAAVANPPAHEALPRFTCPLCGKVFATPPGLHGATVQCPHCRGMVRTSGSAIGEVLRHPPQTPAPAVAPGSPAAPITDAQEIPLAVARRPDEVIRD